MFVRAENPDSVPMTSSSDPMTARRRARSAATFAILALVVVVLALVVVPREAGNKAVQTRSDQCSCVITSDPAAYFPHGYYSHAVNFSQIANGDSIAVGNASFLYEIPSNLETRTTTTGGTTTTIVVTAEYQCGTSLGQRLFFYAVLGNETGFKLDYCMVLNTAIAQGAYRSSTAQSWSLWEISANAAPRVAIHMEGSGEYVSVVELWVGR